MLNFDDWLTWYTSAGFIATVIFTGLFLWVKPDGNAAVGWRWAGAFFLLLLFMRLPFIAYNHELDVDESQMLAQALSLRKLGIYWKYVDGLTQGPLTSYLLILPSWFAMPFDYTSARLLGFIVLCPTLAATFGALQTLFNKPTALICFIPAGFFYLLSQGAFSTLYNEYLVLLLLAVCFWLFALLYRPPYPAPALLFLLGFVAGTTPFAKLQGVPIAMVTVAFAGLIVLQRSPQKLKSLTCLVLGGILFPLIVLGFVIRHNVLSHFWEFYVIGNMEYSHGGTIWQKAMQYPRFARQSGQFFFLLMSYILLIGTSLALRPGTRFKLPGLLFWFGLVQVVVAFYVVTKSGYQFPHYQQFLIIPLAVLAGSIFETAQPAIRWGTRPQLLVWALVCLTPHLLGKIATITGHASLAGTHIRKEDLGKPLQISPVAEEILRFTGPADRMTIWGWHPAYHLETQVPQATSDVIPFRLLTPGPRQKNYQQKYLSDLFSNRPVVFVDVVTNQSFWFDDPEKHKHEHFPGVRDFIAKNYRHVSTIQGERIFVRNDRLQM